MACEPLSAIRLAPARWLAQNKLRIAAVIRVSDSIHLGPTHRIRVREPAVWHYPRSYSTRLRTLLKEEERHKP